MPDQIEMLRPADIAERLGLSAGRIYQLIAAGAIPVVRVGGALRIPRAAWDEWLRARSEEALASLGRAADKCVERGDRGAR
jgi:excisionase family DNA binding protein